MIDSNSFSQFAKSTTAGKTRSGFNCVIYTRVSTKEQADTNASLETQKKACMAYAEKMGLTVVEAFGGTYESAKTDERKEFNRMLNFVKRSKEKITAIIVYSVDRFSRSGANAIYIANELKNQGIVVQAVTQPADTMTPSGSLQQNIHFIFSQYDNEMRRQKCMAGTRERLLQGYWVTKAPKGYDTIRINGEQKIVVNEVGQKIRQAFLWKANEKLPNTEITNRLAKMGVKLFRQDLTKIFDNPFYCGMMVHKALEGEVAEGRHEKLVSKELFLKVHEIQLDNHRGYEHFEENVDIPLKRFMRCEGCGEYLTGYIVRKKNLHYYKCNTKACGCNKSAKQMHMTFKNLLDQFALDPKYFNLAKRQIEATINQLNKSRFQDAEDWHKQLTAIENKLERLEERFIEEEISKKMFDKYQAKYINEKKQIQQQLSGANLNLSNLEKTIPRALEIASNVANMWDSGDYLTRHKVQRMVFPEEMYYDKKTDHYRTQRVNVVFGLLANLGPKKSPKKKGQISNFTDLSHSVPKVGLEPTQV